MKKRMAGVFLVLLMICTSLMSGTFAGAVQGEEMIPEEFFFPEEEIYEDESVEQNSLFFSEEELSALADDPEESSEQEEELQEEIENGSVIALAPVESASFLAEEGLLTASSGQTVADAMTYELKVYSYLNMEEVWTDTGSGTHHLGTAHREIRYVDETGIPRAAPLYCLNAAKKGIGTNQQIKQEAIKLLSDVNIRKILYFGFGGPGDISGLYDPTCSHVDWNKWENRYLMTHYALSWVYSGDVAGATEWECDHVGLNRWIMALVSQPIPDLTDLKFYGQGMDGNNVAAKDMTAKLSLWKKLPDSLKWAEAAASSGVQLSSLYLLTASMVQNGIVFSRSASDGWLLAYWLGDEDFTARGASNPRILGPGESVTLCAGARFFLAFPGSVQGTQTLRFTSIMKPVEYIAVSGDIQENSTGIQDFGSYVYFGDRETLSLQLEPDRGGNILLHKVSDLDHEEHVQGAGYQLTAAENIVSGYAQVLTAGTVLEEAYTDAEGTILFQNLPAGSYYLKEIAPLSGSEAENYLVSSKKYYVTVEKGTTQQTEVYEIPDIRGIVSLRKVIEGTELDLQGAEFTLYTWDKDKGKYGSGVLLTYNRETKRYESEILTYTSGNQGKFRIRETKAPDGFSGGWKKDFALTKLGRTHHFSWTVPNSELPAVIQISKQDSVSGEILENAEFTVYPWNQIKQAYETIGELLIYQEEEGIYRSSELKITDLNQGKFKVEETRNPEGYTGSFSKEIDLNRDKESLQFVVKNDPVKEVKGRISIRKKDSQTGAVLSGAVFEIYQYHVRTGQYENTLGNQSSMYYDREAGLYRSLELGITAENEGKFKVVELGNPEGYHGKWEKEFVLTEENPEPEAFEAFNEPDRPPVGQIEVIKKIRESDILWAHGTPVFSFAVEGTDAAGNIRKYENYVCFSKGAYTVDGEGYAVMKTMFRNVPAGTYEVYEKPVLYYYLNNAAANTANVTVTRGASPEYGKLPGEIAFCTVELTPGNLHASMTFYNTKARYDGLIHNDVIKNTIPVKFDINEEQQG